jgi:hypothetical protein
VLSTLAAARRDPVARRMDRDRVGQRDRENHEHEHANTSTNSRAVIERNEAHGSFSAAW